MAYTITDNDRDHFKEHGYFILRGAVEKELMDRLSDEIWATIPGERDDPESWEGKQGHQPLDAPDVCFQGTPLEYAWHENLWGVAQQLFGKNRVVEPDGIAVLLNYPSPGTEWSKPAIGHLDGYASPHKIDHFSLGVTGYSSKVESNGGSLMFWPGSPNKMYEHFMNHPLLPYMDGWPDCGEGEEFLGEPGDLLFWHSHMMHNASSNINDRVREGLFIRYHHLDRFDTWGDRHEDMWHNWSGISSD